MHCHLPPSCFWCLAWMVFTDGVCIAVDNWVSFPEYQLVSTVTGKTTLASGSRIGILFSTSFMFARICVWATFVWALGVLSCVQPLFASLSQLLWQLLDCHSSVSQIFLPTLIYSRNCLEPGHEWSFYVPRMCYFGYRLCKAELIAVNSLCTGAKLRS